MRVILLLVGIISLPSQDNVTVNARLDRQTAEVGETVFLTVTLQATTMQSPEIVTPEFDGLAVVASTDRSSFRFSTGTGAVREFSREYTLRVEHAGQLTIPPVTVAVDGRLYETEALGLTAVQSTAISSLPGNLEPRGGEEVAVRLWAEPETAYVGQQITMTVAAFFDPLVRNRLQRQPEYRPPDVQGFWTVDLPGPPRPLRRTVGSREYFVQVFRRALFPLTEGVQQIPAAAVIYEVRRGLIYAPETFHVESSPARVVVLPPPERGRPPDFAGAVGTYEAQVSLDREEVAAGEAVNLTLEVRGEGNIRAFPRPSFPEMSEMRVYEGAEEADAQVRGTALVGTKRFSWVLIPERAGDWVIPEIRLPHFDPSAASYRVARTEPLTLTVAPAPAVPLSALNRGNSALRFIKDRPAGEPLDLGSRPVFWVALTLGLLLLLSAHGLARFQRSDAPRRRRPRKPGRAAIRDLRTLADSGDARFFAELRSGILGYLENRLHLPGLSKGGVVGTQHALEDAGVPPGVTLELTDLLEACGRHRYSPNQPSAAERRRMAEAAERLLNEVDREAVSEKRLQAQLEGKGVKEAMILALLLSLPASALAQDSGAASAVEPLFRQGVSAYSRGEHAAAAEYFQRALELQPDDAHILYNLGNAYFELGDEGRAVAMWLRALRLDPRDTDARFNLLLTVGDDPVLGSSLPPLPLSQDEQAILLAVFWLAGCLALGVRSFKPARYLGVVGVASLAIAIAMGTMLLIPRAEYAVVIGRDAALRAGPVAQSEALAFPTAGTGFRVRERRGSWLRVTRTGENEGWISESQVEVIGAGTTKT